MTPAELFSFLAERLDRLDQRLEEHRVIHAQNAANLEAHMRRTDELEKLVTQTRAELKPVALHVAVVGAFGKILAALAALVAVAVGVARLAGLL